MEQFIPDPKLRLREPLHEVMRFKHLNLLNFAELMKAVAAKGKSRGESLFLLFYSTYNHHRYG